MAHAPDAENAARLPVANAGDTPVLRTRPPDIQPSSVSKRWTEEHDQRLRLLAEAGTGKNEIAFALRRTRAAVVSRAALLGIALPKKARGSARRYPETDPILPDLRVR